MWILCLYMRAICFFPNCNERQDNEYREKKTNSELKNPISPGLILCIPYLIFWPNRIFEKSGYNCCSKRCQIFFILKEKFSLGDEDLLFTITDKSN